jgi:hypothetical protein
VASGRRLSILLALKAAAGVLVVVCHDNCEDLDVH